MVTFVDLAPAAVGTFRLRDGAEMPCPGLTPGAIGRLIRRFPELEAMIAKGEVQWSSLLELSDDAVAAAIAAGFGFEGEKSQEKAIHENLSTAEKVAALQKLWEVSVDPLVDVLLDIRRKAEARFALSRPAAPRPPVQQKQSSIASAKPRSG